MGFEKRFGVTTYYKKVRVGNRVVSEYKGSGVMAIVAAALAAEDAALKRRKKAEYGAWEAELAAVFRPVLEFCDHVNSVVESTLEGEGFHRVNRGPWRRKRDQSTPGVARGEVRMIESWTEDPGSKVVSAVTSRGARG